MNRSTSRKNKNGRVKHSEPFIIEVPKSSGNLTPIAHVKSDDGKGHNRSMTPRKNEGRYLK
jgi:hypothetical protein